MGLHHTSCALTVVCASAWILLEAQANQNGVRRMRTLPDHITTMTIDGRQVRLDEQGFLVEPEDWNEAVAEEMARRQSIVLGPDHWDVLRYMRSCLERDGIAPDARFVFGFLDERAASRSLSGRQLFFELFPYGYVGQACRIAGMRQPRAWSTG